MPAAVAPAAAAAAPTHGKAFVRFVLTPFDVAGIVAIENDKVTTITNCTCKCTIDATLYQATSVGAVYVFQKTWEKGVEDTKTVCDEASKTNSAETTIKITTRE